LGRRRIAVVGRRLRGGGTEKEQQCRMCRKPDRSLHVYFLQPRGLSSIWPSIRDSADAANPDPIKRGALVRHLRAQYEWGSRPARWHLVRRVTCHQARGHYQSARFPGQRSVPCRAPVNLSILCDSPGRTPHHSHSIVACTHRKLTLLEETSQPSGKPSPMPTEIRALEIRRFFGRSAKSRFHHLSPVGPYQTPRRIACSASGVRGLNVTHAA